jgi:surface antigen
MAIKKVLSVVLAVILVSACANDGSKQTGGAVLGGATGAILGSQFGHGSGRLIGAAVGGLLGAATGSAIGRNMDERDRQMSQQAAQTALEGYRDNQRATWRNPNNNHSGEFVVTRTEEFRDRHLVCRDFVNTAIIDGKKEQVHGRACRDVRDVKGAWHIQQ